MEPYRLTGGAVVFDPNHRILLKKDPERGWELPGGHVESGESIPGAVVREVREETGLEIEIVKLCGISQDIAGRVCHTFWTARPVGGTLTAGEESEDAGFFTVEEALELIGRPDFRDELIKCLDEGGHPFFMTVGDRAQPPGGARPGPADQEDADGFFLK